MANRWLNLFFSLLLAFNVLSSASGNAEHLPYRGLVDIAEHTSKNNKRSSLRRIAVQNAVSQHTKGTDPTNAGFDSIVQSEHEYLKQTNQNQRRTKDVEDILSGMAHKDPSQWEPTEWVIFLLFISFFGWIACCLCTMCCCGRGGSSNLLGWLLCWEICCRDGRDLDNCCDNYICT